MDDSPEFLIPSYIAVIAIIILFLIGPVDISKPHLNTPMWIDGILILIVVAIIWFLPSPSP